MKGKGKRGKGTGKRENGLTCGTKVRVRPNDRVEREETLSRPKPPFRFVVEGFKFFFKLISFWGGVGRGRVSKEKQRPR